MASYGKIPCGLRFWRGTIPGRTAAGLLGIPTGFHHPAQGWCEARAPTLDSTHTRIYPERVASIPRINPTHNVRRIRFYIVSATLEIRLGMRFCDDVLPVLLCRRARRRSAIGRRRMHRSRPAIRNPRGQVIWFSTILRNRVLLPSRSRRSKLCGRGCARRGRDLPLHRQSMAGNRDG